MANNRSRYMTSMHGYTLNVPIILWTLIYASIFFVILLSMSKNITFKVSRMPSSDCLSNLRE